MSMEVDRDREWLPMMNKIMVELKKLDEKIELVKSNSEATFKSIDKFLKKVK